MDLWALAKQNVVASIQRRYITNSDILPFLKSLPASFNLQSIGKSVLDKDIYGLKVGNGGIKIYMWSQMHGNESTTTKAIVDFLEFLKSDHPKAQHILKHITFLIVPILNPDGAEAYTRVNANGVDLNRDSVELTQPESKILRKYFNEFKPDFAFNMHDQRTLFAAGNENNPATISFLAPSFNKETDINEVRSVAMNIITEMYKELTQYIPNQIGRFDDAFNLNCIGDYFTHAGVPTILFEAGFYPKDYDREITRNIVFVSLVKAIETIISENYTKNAIEDYFSIPENNKLINDILLKNINWKDNDGVLKKNLGIQYKEYLKDGNIFYFPIFDSELVKNHQFGHLEVDASDYEITTLDNLCDLLNKMNLKCENNGVYGVN